MIFVEYRNEKTGRKLTWTDCMSDTLKEVREMKVWLADREMVDVKYIRAIFVKKGGK